MKIQVKETTITIFDVPNADTLNEAVAKFHVGSRLISLLSQERGGLEISEVKPSAAVGAVAGAELVSQLRPLGAGGGE